MPNRQLRALASSLRTPLGSHFDRQAWISRLAASLLDEAHLSQMLARLDGDEKRALRALLDAGGAATRAAFQEQFGPIRVWRPWRSSEAVKPWEHIASPAEALFYSGLLFLWPWQPRAREEQRVLIPRELFVRIEERLSSSQRDGLVALPRPGRPPDLRWHMVVFLMTVAETPRRLIHGRWLPPAMLKLLAVRFGLAQTPDFQWRRSERLMPYAAFVHWLGLEAGLIAHGEAAQITPGGWLWLADEPSKQWRKLWEGWLTGDGDAALRFDLFWGAMPPEARRWMATAVAERLARHGHVALDDLVAWLRLQDERGWLAQPWGVEEDIARQVLRQPLWWLQVLARFEDVEGESHAAITPMGRWLTGQSQYEPAWPGRDLGYFDAQDHTVIHAPVTAPAQALVRLTTWATWEITDYPQYEVRLRLDEARVAGAAARGESLKPLAEALEGLVGRSPSRRLQQRLRQWMKRGRRVRVRRLVALETDSPALMADLHRRRQMRRYLGDVIGPRRAIVDPHHLDDVARHLQTLGLYVNHLASEEAPSSAEEGGALSISRAEAGFLLAAARVFQGLGEYVALPGGAPDGLLMRLADSLDHDEDAAAAFLAEETLKRLAQLVAGYDGLPGWFTPPQEMDPLPIIREALAAEKRIRIAYWLPACGQTSEREVLPYFVETRHDYHYLVGYCFLREDERVFRVDRILRAELLVEKE